MARQFCRRRPEYSSPREGFFCWTSSCAAASAPARRLLNLLTRHIATCTDVVFERVVEKVPQLRVVKNEPALLGGWFRLIELEKRVA
jgi:hypothetical protein